MQVVRRKITTKSLELIILGLLAFATTIALVAIVLSGQAASDVKTAVVVQLSSVLLLVVQAIRNVPQGEVMGRMVDYIAESPAQKQVKEEDEE